MADLEKSNAEWDRFNEREFALMELAPLRFLREARDRFSRTRTQVRVMNDVDGNIEGSLTLAGVNTGVNTLPNGQLIGRVTGTGPYTLTFYMATGGSSGDAVAAGTGAADATVTLTASNSSGITGSVKFAASMTAVTDDSLIVETVLDFKALIPNVFTQSDGIDDDPDSAGILKAACDQVAATLNTAIAQWETAVQQERIGRSGTTGRGNDFLSANETAMATDVARPDTSGNVARVRGGLIQVWRQAMEDETTGSEQFVVRRVPSAAAAVAGSNNQGLGAIASHTPRENCPAGRLVLKCTDGTIGRETFGGYFYIDGSDAKRDVAGVRVGQVWSGPNGLGPFTLTRTLSKTGDGSNTELAAASGFSVTGENASSTDSGILYWLIESNGSNWDLSFFSSSSRAPATLVSKATNIATDGAFVSSAQNGGLVVSGTIGSGPTTSTTGTLNLNVFRVENSAGVPDEFSVTVTVAAAPGLVQTLLAEHFSEDGSYLNSTTAGSETLDDNYVRANTFAAFNVEDN